jgi:hypothetical protein
MYLPLQHSSNVTFSQVQLFSQTQQAPFSVTPWGIQVLTFQIHTDFSSSSKLQHKLYEEPIRQITEQACLFVGYKVKETCVHSIMLSSHLLDLAAIPPLIPPVIVPDLVRRIPSTVTTKIQTHDRTVSIKDRLSEKNPIDGNYNTDT